MCRRSCGGAESGAALMIALGVLAILAMLGGAFVVFMRIEQSRAEYELDALRARYIARGGIEAARHRIRTAEAPEGELTGTLSEGTYSVHLTDAQGAYDASATGILVRPTGGVISAEITARINAVEGSVHIEKWQE
jgi:Tfp pilus assembly protein PilX